MPPATPSPDADISRAEYVYRRLREGIRGGLYRPGQRIREVQIAAELQTSRTPVREAIRRLESDRLVEDVSGSGLAVRRLTPSQLHELYGFRTALEGAAAEMAAAQASDLDIAAMDDALRLMREAASDPVRAAQMNRHFHAAIQRAARNGFLDQALASMADFMALLPGTTYDAPGRMAEVLEEHQAVLDAIRRRAPADAAQAMRAHLQAAAQHRLALMIAHGEAGAETA
jgi:DNA-binding GntR family transcriptional regulator